MFESMLTLDTEWWIPTRRQRGWGYAERSVEEHLAACEVRYREVAAQLSGIGLIASAASPALAPLWQAQLCLPGRPSRPHGPYWHWTAKVAGKTVNRRLSDEEAVLYQEWIANDRRCAASWRATPYRKRSNRAQSRGREDGAEV